MLGVRHEKVGKLRVTYAGWDDAKVVLDAQLLQFGKSQPKTEAAPSVGLPPTEALARELDQAADATVRAMNEVGSAPAALALYRRDEDVPPSTGLPTPGCHLALVRRVVERRPMCSWSLIVAAPIGRLGSRLDSEELRTAWVIQLKPRFGRGH